MKVVPEHFPQGLGFRVQVTSAQATVEDLMVALDSAWRRHPFTRVRRPGHKDCRGCDACCAERAPLTNLDCRNLMLYLELRDLDTLVKRYLTVEVRGPVVDITLRRRRDGRCVFLDRQSRLCRVYSARPFVCRTFFCCPAAPSFWALRQAIVNQGEDELVRWWWSSSRRVHSSHHPQLRKKDWPPTLFARKTSYHQLRLRDLSPRSLWSAIYSGGGAS
ncbi:YkgJ family cysteine cluster protein [Desulfothermobacter acidiphilus]|uniref:YkgJ family cysteine cluster protein n=1 Tax=Desulfothermobacter acidiphilus TaxID=1938353 RepID=UPI003F89A0D2